MVPEEMPVVLTVFLALGAWRISRQGRAHTPYSSYRDTWCRDRVMRRQAAPWKSPMMAWSTVCDDYSRIQYGSCAVGEHYDARWDLLPTGGLVSFLFVR
jgi:hypothetical protein